MDRQKTSFPLSLTFDDILLLPGYAGFSRSEIKLDTRLTKNIRLTLPLVSAPMDTVTESELAIELANLGGIGVIHRNLTIEKQVEEVKKVRKIGLMVGAAVGGGSARPLTPEPARQSPDGSSRMADGRSDGGRGFEDRVAALVKAQVSVILVDSAHGFSKQVIDATKFIRKTYPKMEIISGNISTADGAEALIKAGATGLRVGMGPGAICTTRVISGMGVPQVTALIDTVRVAKKFDIPIIADGGIKYSGDMVKALALGASTCMMGSYFASSAEAPGTKVRLSKDQVPRRFQSIFEKNKKTYLFKSYRGMGSIAAMQKGAKIKSEGEFHGKSYNERVLVAEGVEGLVPVKGSVKELTDQAVGGIKSGMYYVGAKNLPELFEKAKFSQITQASLTESHPHSVLITNAGQNY